MARVGSLAVVLVAIAIALWYRTQNMSTARTPGRLWADGPIPMIKTPMFRTKKDDTFTKGATHMAIMHNAVLRGYNSLYLQAPYVKTEDYADFIGYTAAWCKFVISHHDAEEQELFPQTLEVLQKEDQEVWGRTHNEHEVLVPAVTALQSYLASLASPADLSREKLVSLVAEIKQPLHTHFHSEIVTIAALSSYGDFPAAAAIFQAWGKKSLTGAGYTDVVPFLFTNIDRTYERGMWKDWPPMPAAIRWGISRVAYALHPGWWKFASCDLDGYPKDLYALRG